MQLRRRVNGDTIVEVLLAIAVVGAVLGGAFVASNGALKASQAARERSEAIRRAENQIEKLKFLSASGGQNITQPGLFCLDASLSVRTVTDQIDMACAEGSRYASSIAYDGTSSTYTISIVWENITGNRGVPELTGAYDRIIMHYRVYPQ